jgi:DNA-binding transcriptional ArsR family regulator
LPFAALSEFLPHWSTEERVAAYAVVGGVPAYLEWLDPERSLSDNIRQVMLSPGSMWVAEPIFLLYDEVREPGTHLAILKAIGAGNHTLSEISDAALVSKAHLSAYLARLQELRLVERRLPVTIPPAGRGRARSGRYHLMDPYFRFYFRFIAPYQDDLAYRPEEGLPRIREGLRGFVGLTAFEELSRQWASKRGGRQVPFVPQDVSHWSRTSSDVGLSIEQGVPSCWASAWGADAVVVRRSAGDRAKDPRLWGIARGALLAGLLCPVCRTVLVPARRGERAGASLVDMVALDAALKRASQRLKGKVMSTSNPAAAGL